MEDRVPSRDYRSEFLIQACLVHCANTSAQGVITKILQEEGHMAVDPVAGATFRCSIAAWLSVRNSARAVDFYKSAFGATEVYRLEDPGGGVVAKLSVDGA